MKVEGKMKQIQYLLLLILISLLLFQSCSHIITTTMVSSQDAFHPNSGYIYGCFKKQYSGLYIGKGDQAEDLIIALELEPIEDQTSSAAVVHIPFMEAKGEWNNLFNPSEDHADTEPGEKPQLVKLPPGVYRITDVIFATSSGRIKSRKKIPSYPVFDHIKVKPGVLTYIGSWKGTTTASGVGGFDGLYSWALRKAYDFFIEETYQLEKEYPKTKSIRKYNTFTDRTSDRLPILVAALKSKHESIRAGAAAELGKIGNTKAVQPLIELINDQEMDVVKNTILALGKIGDKRAVDPLIDMLKHKDNIVRGFAASALGKIGDARAADILFTALKDKDNSVQEKAIEALGKIGDAHCIELLITALRSKKKRIRYCAAYALGQTGDPRAVDPLINIALKDKEDYVQNLAARALSKLGDDDTVMILISTLKENPDIRGSAARVLGEIGDIRAVEPLITALKDQDEHVRRFAANALGKIKDARAIEPLITAIKDDDVYVRKSSIRILGLMGDDRAIEPLIAALKDQETTVRSFAARALGHFCDPKAIDALITFLKNEDKYSNKNFALENAAYSLKEITNKEFGTDYQKWAEWWKKNKKNFYIDNN